ncbi:MAG: hypothetical protein NTY97_10150 [Planctomycetota bacterium]|jgi:hypothetical protein|nr:hypothetical protein [Planctomycetota bacterium]
MNEQKELALMTKKTPSDSNSEEQSSDRDGSVVDRRLGVDRRDISPASPSNLERRRGPGRRLTDFVKSAEEGEMSREQYTFLLAIDVFKRVNHKTFPSWTDVLEVVRKLGYRKTMPSELNLGGKSQDWTEKPDSISGVNKPSVDSE